MEEFIIYILKSGLCLGLFLVTYTLFLRPATFFKFNRAFLITGILTSFIIPAIHYTYDVVMPIVTTGPVISEINNNMAVVQDTSVSTWGVCFLIYIAGITILAIRNLVSYVKLNRLIKAGVKSDSGYFKIVENRDIKSPFTILNYILINTKNLSNIEKDLILKHEITHIDQKHWIDLFCSECVLLLQWFNPFTWIYVRLLKENHEFLADKAVIDSGISPAVYQAVLVNQRFQGQVFSFSNSFNYGKSLNRLAMIKKSESSPWKRISALAIIPVFGFFIWASAEPNYIVQESLPAIASQEFEPEKIQEKTDPVKIKYSSSAKKDTIIPETKGSIVYITKVGNRDNTKDEEAQNNDTPDKPVIRVLSVRHKSEDAVSGNVTISEEKPLVFIDGQKSDLGKIKELNPDEIDNINVLKDESAKEPYGEEAKNGVILINTKQAKAGTGSTTVVKKNVPVLNMNSDNLLVILDGKEISPDAIKHISPDKIESVSVLKGKSSVEIYGDKGKYGTIVFTSKK
ncbi:MAG: TonB-dependent receptor plug domain-containing protein [Prevotella sp.]|jgi:TonB-dependent SusC/RagA subfamily outer membrane receptor|nr:TonB-dependent receptor plug domain-containing protein [Prevotella sp.]